MIGLSLKDAKTLVSIDNGERLRYYDQVSTYLDCSVKDLQGNSLPDGEAQEQRKLAQLISNW